MKIFEIFIIGLLVSVSSYFRLRGVTGNGIIGSDTFQYLDIALMWHNGQYALNNDPNEYYQFFRPMFYALNVLSFYLFGVNDYAMRLLLGVFESLNIVLVFLVAKVYFRNSLYSLSLTALYATIPSGISLSLRELPHTYSVTFVLLAYLVLLIGLRKSELNRKESSWHNFIAGIFTGCAAVTHGSTTFLGPVIVAIIGLNVLIKNKNKVARKFIAIIKQSTIFTIGFFLNYLFWGAIVGFRYMVSALVSEMGYDTGSDLTHLQLFLSYLRDGPRLSMHETIFYAFYAAVVVFVLRLLIVRKTDVIELSPYIVFLFFCALFSLVFRNVFYERLFLPMNIFVLLMIFNGIKILLVRQHYLARFAGVLLLTVVFAYQAFVPRYPALANISAGNDKGGPRFVYDYIGQHVTASSKLLVAPYLQWMHRPQFKSAVYFADNALYLMECGNSTIDEFIIKNQIKFIFVSKNIDPTIALSDQTRYNNLGLCSGMDKNSYDIEKDLESIDNYLLSNNAEKIAESELYGALYSLH